MCLIMLREKGITLDKEKWDAAVLNNPDGWGISVPDMKGTLLTIRDVVTDGDALYELLHTEYKDDPVMIHLRYTTAGETILRNAHPFPVLEYEADGVDMRMAHNGTLPRWTPGVKALNAWASDTRCFVKSFVRPLMKRFSKGMSSADILTDPFIDRLLDSELTTMSVLTFIDGFGNFSVVNESGNGGFTDLDGTYFSNTYSHDVTHRLPYAPYAGGTNMGKTTTPSGQTGTNQVVSTTKNTTVPFTDLNVKLFTEKHNIPDVTELHLMSDETIVALVEDEPSDAILLIKQLLAEHFELTRVKVGMTRTITTKLKDIRDLEEKLKVKELTT